jgi:hypothetical protein
VIIEQHPNQIGFLLSYNRAAMASLANRNKRRSMMRELVERVLEEAGTRRRVQVNQAESPMAWLAARGHVSLRQLEAGERLRADYETAALGPRVTMRWDAAPVARAGGVPERLDPTLAQIAARRRFDGAVAAAGPGLADILWRVVCAGEGLGPAEKALGWPSRAGKLVLSFALDRIADFYGLK